MNWIAITSESLVPRGMQAVIVTYSFLEENKGACQSTRLSYLSANLW